jgi:hypothetical protein
MSSPGDADDLLIRARSALLDALDALGAHRRRECPLVGDSLPCTAVNRLLQRRIWPNKRWLGGGGDGSGHWIGRSWGCIGWPSIWQTRGLGLAVSPLVHYRTVSEDGMECIDVTTSSPRIIRGSLAR